MVFPNAIQVIDWILSIMKNVLEDINALITRIKMQI